MQVTDPAKALVEAAKVTRRPRDVELRRQSHSAAIVGVEGLVDPPRWEEHSLTRLRRELKEGFPACTRHRRRRRRLPDESDQLREAFEEQDPRAIGAVRSERNSPC